MNNAAMNIVEQMYLWYEYASFGYMPKSGIARSRGRLVPNFLRKCHIDFQSGCISLHSHQQRRSVPLTLHPFQHKISLMFFDFSHSEWHKMESHSHFDLHFPDE